MFRFKSGHPAKPPRTLEEMESEAQLLKEEIKKMTEADNDLHR
jgi:hypothetical protein